MIGRREFISLLGGGAMWPLVARAQQGERMRRIGVLMSTAESDQRGLEYITGFAQGLAELGWTVGRNVRIEYRWGSGDLERFRSYAAELIALSPDVVLATAGSIVGRLLRARRERPRRALASSVTKSRRLMSIMGYPVSRPCKGSPAADPRGRSATPAACYTWAG